MKRTLKRSLVLLLVLALLFVCSGCKALDTMRQNQAYYNGSGDVLYNGSVYKKLPACEELQPKASEALIYVTETDVPVLLSSALSLEILRATQDKGLLVSLSGADIYCREDMHQQMSQRIRNGFTPEVVCYSYNVYGEDVYDSETVTYVLTQEQVELITRIVENTEPTTLQDGMYLDCQGSVFLEECSEDLLFRRNTMDISYTENAYYLQLYTDQGELLFTVPSACNEEFDQITKAYRESEQVWDDYWEDEEIILEDDFI